MWYFESPEKSNSATYHFVEEGTTASLVPGVAVAVVFWSRWTVSVVVDFIDLMGVAAATTTRRAGEFNTSESDTVIFF